MRAARLAAFLAAFALFAVSPGGAQNAPPAPAAAAEKAAAPAVSQPAGYIGSETCKGCHAPELFEAFEKSPHHLVETSKKYKFETRACEACHGPGGKHAESMSVADIQRPAKLKPADMSRVCLACHGNQSAPTSRIDGSHAGNQVSCLACHAIHKNEPNALVRRTTADINQQCLSCHSKGSTQAGRAVGSRANDDLACISCHPIHKNEMAARRPADVNKQCAGCHADVWASFQQPFRHRLAVDVGPAGAMLCVDCHPDKRVTGSAPATWVSGSDPSHNPHNPHGISLPEVILAKGIQTVRANEPVCFKCHGNLAGPFTYEHAPVRMEGCTACHMPHGSSNPRMLTRSQVRFVCLECHSNLPAPAPAANAPLGGVPPAYHDLRSPRYQNCTLCHQKVHGSYVDRGLLR